MTAIETYLPLQDVAKKLAVTPTTLRLWAKRGTFPPVVRVGNGFRVSEQALADWLRTRTWLRPTPQTELSPAALAAAGLAEPTAPPRRARGGSA